MIEKSRAALARALLLTGCDHKFVDSNVCLRCGASEAELRGARAKE